MLLKKLEVYYIKKLKVYYIKKIGSSLLDIHIQIKIII